MGSSELGKWMIGIGFIVVLIGIALWVFGKLGFSIGHLPGDINIKKDNFSFHFPVITSIILSIVITIVLNLMLFFFRNK